MKGRKPDNDAVVPLTDGVRYEDHEAAALAKAGALKPAGLDEDVSRVWDRIAPKVCHPTVDRLKPHMLETFVLMCKVLARYERLASYLAEFNVGETYVTETRNGVQWKSRPEVGQMNEAFRQFLTLARDFGLTPAAERGLKANPNQGMLPFEAEDFA